MTRLGRFFFFLRTWWVIGWELDRLIYRNKSQIVHWHLVGCPNREILTIIWDELHQAEIRYEARLNELNQPHVAVTVRPRRKRGA